MKQEPHPDVFNRPLYVLANPGCYTRAEVDLARRVAWAQGAKQ